MHATDDRTPLPLVCPHCGGLYTPATSPDPRADDVWDLTPLGWPYAPESPRQRFLDAPIEEHEGAEATFAQAYAELRMALAEFISCTPESEPDATLELRFPDGVARQLTRGQITARAKWLRPRMRRIYEQRFIRHRTRIEIIEEMGCSMKTLERDWQGALMLLLAEARAV